MWKIFVTFHIHFFADLYLVFFELGFEFNWQLVDNVNSGCKKVTKMAASPEVEFVSGKFVSGIFSWKKLFVFDVLVN